MFFWTISTHWFPFYSIYLSSAQIALREIRRCVFHASKSTNENTSFVISFVSTIRRVRTQAFAQQATVWASRHSSLQRRPCVCADQTSNTVSVIDPYNNHCLA